MQFPIVILADSAHGPSNRSKADKLIHIEGKRPLIIPSLSPSDDILRSAMCEYSARRESAETRRLLYVALTRAIDHLVITGYERKNISPESLYSIYMEGNAGAYIGKIPRIPDIYEGIESSSAPLSLSWYDNPVSREAVYNEKRFGVKDASHKESAWSVSSEKEELPSLSSDSVVAKYGIYQDFGVMVHSMLELLLSGRTYAPQYPPLLDEDERYIIATALDEIKTSFLSSHFYKTHIENHEMEAEVRFYYPYGDSVAEGSADLLVFGSDYNLVVDYKTDRFMDESEHRAQITAYAKAMEDLYKKKCLAVLLYVRGMTEGTFVDSSGDEIREL